MSIYTTAPLTNAEDLALAKLSSQELSAVLASGGENQEISITDKDGKQHQVTVPAGALQLLIEVLMQLGQGNSVNITPIHAEMTTQEAANYLNMSRPTLIKLLDAAAIPHSRVGNRRKVAYADVLTYKQNLEQDRLNVLDQLSELDQEYGGMGYHE